MSDAPSNTRPARWRAPRWMWIVLIASLAINLLGIGIVAGSFWQVRHARATAGGALPGTLAKFADTLPPARGAEIRDAVRAAQAAMTPLKQEARQARREAALVFSSEPFDKVKFAAAHSRALAATLEVRHVYLRLLTEIGEKLSSEERRRFLEWREQHRGRESRWRGDEHRENGSPTQR
jgi:uncharacterized membrane protein